jgi:hypothetical protein
LSKRTPKAAARAADLPSKPTRSTIVRPPKSKYTRGLNEAIDADAGRVVSIYSEAETGRIARLIDLYKGTRVIDGRLNSVSNARVLSIVGRPIVWKAPRGFETDAEVVDSAAKLTRLWDSQRRMTKVIGHLAHAVLEGPALGELHYEDDARTGWVTARIEPVRSNRLMYVDEKPHFLQDSNDRDGIPLADAPEKWIFHQPGAGAADYPWRLGALRTRIIPSTIKRFTLRAWISLLERWGQPQIAAFYDPDMNPGGTGDDPATLITDALKIMGVDWRAAFPKGTEITPIPVSVSDALHKTFIDAQNVEDAIAILGQNLTTEVTGGSFAATAAHRRVSHDILAADWAELAETITDDWAARVMHYNRPGVPVPYAEAVLTPKREIGVAEYQADLYSAQYTQTSNGHDAEPGPIRFYSMGRPSAAPLAGSQPTGEAPPSAPSVSGPGASTADNPVGVVPVAAPVADAPATLPGGEAAGAPKAAEAALNGAQVSSLMDIVKSVAAGEIPRATGIELITAAFPIDQTKAEKIMGTVGTAAFSQPSDSPAATPAL